MTELTLQKLQIFRALDKKDRLGLQGVFDLLTTGRRDESGDFTPGAGLLTRQAVVLVAFVASGEDTEEARNIRALNELAKENAIFEDDYGADWVVTMEPSVSLRQAAEEWTVKRQAQKEIG